MATCWPGGDGDDPYADVAHVREWPEKERLKGEKDTLGLYLTGHPFDEYEPEVRRFVRSAIADLETVQVAAAGGRFGGGATHHENQDRFHYVFHHSG